MRKSVWGQQLLLAVMMVGIGLVVVVAGLALFASTFTLLGGCSDTVKQEFPSPGSAVAIVYVTNCGATTPFVTSVSVQAKGETLDAGNERVFFRVRDDVDIEIRWPDDVMDGHATRIEVLFPAGSRVIRQAIRWDGLTIEYRER
jgi:hypothetical protein